MYVWILAATLALFTSCAPQEESADRQMIPSHRFVDLLHPDVQEGAIPQAALADETRIVLQGHLRMTVRRGIRVNQPGNPFRRRLRVPTEFSGEPRVIVAPRMSSEGRWQALPSRLARVRSDGDSDDLVFDVVLNTPGVGTVIGVDAIRALPDTNTRIDTPPVEIPDGSYLELGLGILEPAWSRGPTVFRVSICEHDACQPILEEKVDPGTPEGRRWKDRRIALDRWSGSTRSFRFETHLVKTPAGSFSLPVWSNPTVFSPAPPGSPGPHIVLVSLDTLRADRLPSYGYPLQTAPFLDARFAQEGTLFESAVAAAATTGPSHMTLFTSLHPSVHGVTGITGSDLDPSISTLAERLRRAGFSTVAFTENAVLNGSRGFARGFELYWENKRRDVEVAEGHVEETFAAARRWLERNSDKRLFLFLHTYQVHDPFSPPERYRTLFVDGPPGAEHRPTPPEWNPVRYDQEIRYTDDQLAEMFRFLETLGVAQNGYIVVTSDHGEEFLEHGAVGHGAQLHTEVTHVPLFFRGPGIAAATRVNVPVGHVDLLPTLLELLGLERPDGVQGRSLAAMLTNEGASSPPDPVPLISEAWSMQTGFAHEPRLAVRAGSRKLIRRRVEDGYSYHYYDLEDDPGEEHDLYPERPDEAADLRELLDHYNGHARALRATLVGAEGPEPSAEIDLPALDPERAEKLRALGYIE